MTSHGIFHKTPLWLIGVLLITIVVSIILLLEERRSVRQQMADTQRWGRPEWALQRVAFTIRTPLTGDGEFPPFFFRDQKQHPTVSWRVALVDQFETGPITSLDRQALWSSPANAKIAAMHHQIFCVDMPENSTQTTIFAAQTGKSLFEIGNSWRQEKPIPDDTLVAIYLPGGLNFNWTEPGDLCLKAKDECEAALQIDQLGLSNDSWVIAIFWDLESWEFRGRDNILAALRFANLEVAAKEDRVEFLKNKGTIIRPASSLYK